jgi:hypothetical protein
MIARRLAAIVFASVLLGATGACRYLGLGSRDRAGEEVRPEAARPAIRSANDLIRAMQSRNNGRWYSTLSLTGETTRWGAGREASRNRWNQYVNVPGRMRVEFLPWTSRGGVLFEGGRVHTFADGRRIDTQRQVHPLLLLGSDIYVAPANRTLAELRALGVATQRFRETTWGGRRVYIIGGERGDTTSTQAWFDAERLAPVRWIHRETRDGRSSVADTRLQNYRRIGAYFIPHEVVGYRDGRRVLREVYSNVRVNPTLSPALFDPDRWRDAPRPGNR